MSTRVSGIVCAKRTSVNYEVGLAFHFEKVANQKKIGCKFGGNVSPEVLDSYSKGGKEYAILFELLDTPLDNCAEELFGPDMMTQDADDLMKRMNNVQNLFEEILEYPQVVEIVLDINYLMGMNEKIVRLKISDFAETVSSLYATNSVFPPVIRVVLHR